MPIKALQDCPALRHQALDYPAAFAGRVPQKLRLLVTVYARHQNYGCAEIHSVHPAWTSVHGEVGAVLSSGLIIWLQPGEFEVIAWHSPKRVRSSSVRKLATSALPAQLNTESTNIR